MTDDTLKFTFGLINSSDRYLTAETFNFKIDASATGMKQRQIWCLEQEADGSCVYFKSCLNRYLGTDKYGKVRCDDETPGKENAFHVEATADGRWAIKSAEYDRYFGGSPDCLDCFGKDIDNNRLWIVHLAMHPQMNLYSLTRKKFAAVEGDELQVTQLTPWGVNTLITLVYRERGYGLMTADNRYLSKAGTLEDSFGPSTRFTLEFYAGCIAFKDMDGKYLSPIGPKGAIQSRKGQVSKDEKFSMQDSHPQFHLKSKTRNKFVSVKQGVQVVANQEEPSEDNTETFQMEINPDTGFWSFRTTKDNYWRSDMNNNVMANNHKRDDDSWFQIEWRGRSVRLRTASGKYVAVKSGGNLILKSDESDAEEFVLTLINRPVIVFRCMNSFIGIHGEKLNGKRANYDIFTMEEKDGAYAFKGRNGKYWALTGDSSIAINSAHPEYFIIELVKHSRLMIRPEQSDKFLVADKVTGTLTASGCRDDEGVLWEY
ncbi:fascin-like [Styela clava]